MIVTTKKLFEHAYGKYALGAYNINNLEQIEGLSEAIYNLKPPLSFRSAKVPVRIPISFTSRRLSAQQTKSTRKPFLRCIWIMAMKLPAMTVSNLAFTAQ